MRPSPPSRTSSEAASSLEDSSYDIISNTELSEGGLISDEDTRTESLASFGDNTPDDISVINSGEDSEEEGGSLDTPLDSFVIGSHYLPLLPRTDNESLLDVAPVIDDSTHTSRTIRPTTDSLSSSYFEFDRDHIGDDLVHNIQSLGGANHTAELSVYGSPYVGVSMHMAVSNVQPRLPDTFHMLVVSHESHSHLIQEIAGHIEAALDAHKQHEGKDKDIQVLVDHCIAANSNHNGKREIQLTLQDFEHPITIRGGQAWSGKESHPLPDLAVFLHTSLAEVPAYEVNQHEVTFETARLAMTSSNVPILDLSQYHPLYMAVPHSYICGKKSLHLRVTTKQNKDAQEISRELLPADLDKFFAIDPFILGKHLASISQDGSGKPTGWSWWKAWELVAKAVAKKVYAKTWKSIEPAIRAARNRTRYLEHCAWVDIFLGVLFALLTITIYAQVQSYDYNSGAIQTSLTTSAPTFTPVKETPWAELYSHTIAPSLDKHTTAIVEMDSVSTACMPDCKENRRSGTLIKSADYNVVSGLMANKAKSKESNVTSMASMRFTVKVHENKIILAPREDWASQTKSAINIKVYKDGNRLNALVKRTATGAWHIELDPEQAQGQATIRVSGSGRASSSRETPLIYDVPIDLGSRTKAPRLIADFSHFVQHEVSVAQTYIKQEVAVAQNGAKELSTRMSTSLVKYYQQSQKLQRDTLRRIDDTRKALLDLSCRTTGVDLWTSSPLSALMINQDVQLKKVQNTQKAVHKQSHNLAQQLGVTIRTMQQLAMEPYRNAAERVQNIQTQHWPVKAKDWRPSVAIKRGSTNARHLARRLRNSKNQDWKHGRSGKTSPPKRGTRC